jgi:dimethylaniline monooxygenase (N-oxide forming)
MSDVRPYIPRLAHPLQYDQLNIPKDSPLRSKMPLFWNIKVNFEGPGSPTGYHAHALSGAIKIIAPAHVQSFGADGKSVVLSNGSTIGADAVVLGTGFKSSWNNIFDSGLTGFSFPKP